MIVANRGLGVDLDAVAAQARGESVNAPSANVAPGQTSYSSPSEGGGSGPGISPGDVLKMAPQVFDAAGKLISSGTSSSAGVKATTPTATTGSFVLAAGASWSKVRLAIFAPTCADEYSALLKQYNTRLASPAAQAMRNKVHMSQPLSQSDLVVIRWLAVAAQKLRDFRSKYTGVKANWPTACYGVKAGTILPQSTSGMIVGVAVLAVAGLVVWKLL